MTNEEAIEIFSKVKELPCGWCYEGGDEFKQAINLAIEALKEIEGLEDENHRNFVNSQHIISLLVEENKKLRGEE